VSAARGRALDADTRLVREEALSSTNTVRLEKFVSRRVKSACGEDERADFRRAMADE
jgi:hypothetical protein